MPGVLNPVELLMKTKDGKLIPFHGSGHRWRDGSLTTDIPERDLHLLFGVNYTIVSQVNPHILIFFFDRQGSAGSPARHRNGKGWRGGFIGSSLTQYLKLDLQKWLYLVRDLTLFPKLLNSDLSHIFLQKFEGSITIVPHAKLSDFFNLLADPDEKRMRSYLENGQKRTWPKLGMIGNRLKIELVLEAMLLKHGNEKI